MDALELQGAVREAMLASHLWEMERAERRIRNAAARALEYLEPDDDLAIGIRRLLEALSA